MKINSKKSSGVDGISNFVLRKFPDTAIQILTCLFNYSINIGYFPQSWKEAKIIPVKKKPRSDLVTEFRPISFLSNVGKIFEYILKEKLKKEFIINPISDFQFGFQIQHFTQHALLKFHSDITTNLRNQICTVAISLDIEKAFDSVCHKGIIYKLIDLSVDPFLVNIINNYLSDRKFFVQINSKNQDMD